MSLWHKGSSHSVAQYITVRLLVLAERISSCVHLDDCKSAGANIGIVLLSHLAGGAGFLQHGVHACPRPVEIAFPEYTDAELVQVRLPTIPAVLHHHLHTYVHAGVLAFHGVLRQPSCGCKL